jgi:hypothetical protein
MAPINIQENLDRINEGIENFKTKSADLEKQFSKLKEENIEKFNRRLKEETSECEKTQRNMKEEILRLEGCKMVYETLKEVYGDYIPSAAPVSSSSCMGEDHLHTHGCDEPPPPLTHGCDEPPPPAEDPPPRPPPCNEENKEWTEDRPMALHELYKKYRAM